MANSSLRRSPRKRVGDPVQLPPSATPSISAIEPSAIPVDLMSSSPSAHPVQADVAHAPQSANGPFYPPYAFPAPSLDGQTAQGQQVYNGYANSWPYAFHPYYYPPRGTLAPPQASAQAQSPVAPRPPAPLLAEAAFGIDPARLAQAPSYSSSPSANSDAPALGVVGSGPPSPVLPVTQSDQPAPTTNPMLSPMNDNASTQDDEEGNNDSDEDDSNDEDSPSRKRRRAEGEVTDEQGRQVRRKGSLEKRMVASRTNPLWDHVIGAGTGEMRTAEEQDSQDRVFRTRRLRSPYFLQSAATRHYRRTIPDILTRVESLASRTGCYAYIALQHPESCSNFYYYASKKLREEAPSDVKEIHRKVGDTMSKLLKAHKAAKVTLQAEVQKAKAQAASAEERAAEAQAKAQALAEELAQLKAAAED